MKLGIYSVQKQQLLPPPPPSQQLLKKGKDLKQQFFSDSSWTKKTNTPIYPMTTTTTAGFCRPIIFLLLPVFWRDSDEWVLGTWSPFGLQLEAKG